MNDITRSLDRFGELMRRHPILSVLIGAVVVVALGVVASVAGGHSGSSGASSPQHYSKPTTPVQQLEADGYTPGQISSASSSGTVYAGCSSYAVGNAGNGTGQLVVQCDSSSAAQELALNLDAQVVNGVFVVKNGPLPDL